jgi:ABC-type branched-subunit amino acid transport system substrate-binding protein
MILPTASEDTLLTNFSYAFRITPTSQKQARIAASYINTYLHSKHILLFYDDTDPFSGPLAQHFKDAYKSYGNGTISEQPYKVGNRSSLQNKLDDLLTQDNHPDLIYFAGYPADLITLLNNSSITNPFAPNYYTSLKIVGGDSLYEVNAPYPSGIYKHLLFTAAASPDVWKNKKLPAPAFFGEYGANFDPTVNNSGTYGMGRADADAILNYDALLALLNGYTKSLQIASTPTLQTIKQGLDTLSPFQGASGLISLKDDNGENPDVNKVMVMLVADQDGHTQIQQVYGCLTLDYCY